MQKIPNWILAIPSKKSRHKSKAVFNELSIAKYISLSSIICYLTNLCKLTLKFSCCAEKHYFLIYSSRKKLHKPPNLECRCLGGSDRNRVYTLLSSVFDSPSLSPQPSSFQILRIFLLVNESIAGMDHENLLQDFTVQMFEHLPPHA